MLRCDLKQKGESPGKPPRASPFFVSLPMALADSHGHGPQQAGGRAPARGSESAPGGHGERALEQRAPGRWPSLNPRPAGRAWGWPKGRVGPLAAEREGPCGLQGGSVPGSLPVGRPARGPELQAATFGRGGSRPSPIMLLFRLSKAASEPASPVLSLPWLCARLGSLARGCKCGESEAASATPREVHSA